MYYTYIPWCVIISCVELKRTFYFYVCVNTICMILQNYRTFTPMLADWYNKFKKGPNGDLFDIIFVSSDSNEGEWMDYFLQMPWYSLPYDPEKKACSSVFLSLKLASLDQYLFYF